MDGFDQIQARRFDEALETLRRADPTWVLAFAGIQRPSHRQEEMVMIGRTERLAEELGLSGAGAVHFRQGWTPYAERGALLLEADIGVVAHRPTAEARLSCRSRMLDFVWAALPIACTSGDEWSDTVVTEHLGAAVPPEDADTLAAAVHEIAGRGRQAYDGAFAAARERRTWSESAKALERVIEFLPTRGPRVHGIALSELLAIRHSGAARAQTLAQASRRALTRD